jgi:hypothetical protein
MPKDKKHPWPNEKLGRKEEGNFLTEYLVSKYEDSKTLKNESSFVLNINSGWGFGKTYFLQNWKMDLDEAGYPVVYFNAWENDFSDNPLLAFISEINDQLSPFFDQKNLTKEQFRSFLDAGKKLVKPTIPILLSIIAKKLTGMTTDEFREALSDEDNNNDNQEKYDKETEK